MPDGGEWLEGIALPPELDEILRNIDAPARCRFAGAGRIVDRPRAHEGGLAEDF